ncbi:MAG: alkaline phosphatase family protein [Saprospiraceae bacterium]
MSATASTQSLPVPDHIVIVILEDHEYPQIVNSPAAPFITTMAADTPTAVLLHSFAITHPSQPNFLDLYSGCNQGVTDNNVPASIPFTTDNLGRQLIDAGKTFITYSEDLLSVGFNGATSGKYARKHNPAANWMGSGTNQIPASTNQPLTAFPFNDFNLLPTVCFVIPNLDNDMENGTDPDRISRGDTWVHDHFNTYYQWTKTHNSLFILTFDEDDNTTYNHILTFIHGQQVLDGIYLREVNHYDILRTIEEMYDLPYACNAAGAIALSDIWNISTAVENTSSDLSKISIYPNPAHKLITVELSYNSTQPPVMNIMHITGQVVKRLTLQSISTNIDISDWMSGIYLYQIQSEGRVTNTGKFVVE